MRNVRCYAVQIVCTLLGLWFMGVSAAQATLETMHSFPLPPGATTEAELLLAPDEKFYGTTFGSGLSNRGTVFRVAPDGTFRTLASVSGGNGASPRALLVLAPGRMLYGTTERGGESGLGTISRIGVEGAPATLLSFGTKPCSA